MRMKRFLRCYTGPYDSEHAGLIVCYSQRQAQNLLKIGHKKFTDSWAVRDMPDWATKFVVYLKRADGPEIWVERGD